MAGSKKKFQLDEEETHFETEEHTEDFDAPEDQHYEEEDYDEGDYDRDQNRVVHFLKYPQNKRDLKEFIEDTYRAYERENVERAIARQQHEHESELQGSTDYYKPGHIGPLMYQYLNMVGAESAFVSGLQHTKASMTKTLQQKVDEINTLLRGVGGFNRQIKASFSRSATLYLEQEDPRTAHRERVIFTVNLGDFELRFPLDESADKEEVEDGRTLRRLVWDEAVNTVSEIVSNTGMKPKYVKNDKNSCRMLMKQYLLQDGHPLPDEYFSFDLKHVNKEQREALKAEYQEKCDWFQESIEQIDKKLQSSWVSQAKKDVLEKERAILDSDYEFYRATTPDPSEMDTGLVFSIYVNTIKDYNLTKDKMQVIMTKFILALSSIATDKSSDQQVNQVYQQKQAKSVNYQDLDEMIPQKKKRRAS
jgi:hypothetical protein